MTASPQTRNYLYGKGELFFRAVGSEGYDHLGNAPAFTISLTEEKLEHFSSMSGTKTKDLQLVTQKGATVAFTLEEFTTGNILRAAVKAGTPIGRKAKAFMDAGKLVPDEVIIGIVAPRFRRVQKLTDHLNLVARENLNGINVVHAFNAERYQNDKFDEPSTKMMETQLKNQRLMAVIQPAMGLCMNALALVIYWLGAALINQISLADTMARLNMFSEVVVFSTYATYVVMSFMMMVMIFMMLPSAQVSAERINEVLDCGEGIVEGGVSESGETGTVEFRDVSFRYPDSNENELNHISFRLGRGKTLAIIGATGSGKSTLISLIPRFYDATEGEVLVDGVNVRDYSFDALYDRLGYVTQKAVLFSGSIRDNVLFGESRGNGDAAQAIDIAQAREFVDKLPDGEEHRIAQLGRNVSGGQKQRLSIARALARKPEILIFDDSFSALDYKTDAALRAELNGKLSGTTKIIVAQRISTIRHADEIIVLDRGEAVGIGTHDELMRSCAVYQEIARSQLSAAELA